MADNDVFCLQLQHFDSNIKDSWKEIQMQKDFCDVTLACDDKQIEAHKVIISSSSPVLRNILKQNSNPHPFIYLRGVKYKDLSNLLNFMYRGEVKISQEELNSFLAMAEDLKIRGLSEHKKGKVLKEERQSPHSNMLGEDIYDPPKIRKFDQKLDEKEFHKKAKVKLNNDQNKETENSQLSLESWDQANIVNQSDRATFPVSTIKHKKNDAGLYSCDNCGKQFTTSQMLQRHVEAIHEGIRYSCNQCDYKATQKASLRKHTQSVHEKICYPCLQCDYKATQTCNLKTHVKKYHA